MAKADSDIPNNLIGFVNDPISEQIIISTIKEMSMTYSDVMQGNFTDVINFLKNNKAPKILIIDISDIELPLNEVIKIMEYTTPDVNFIVVGSRNEVGLFRDLMAAGISDYLVKPLNIALLRESIEDINNGKRKTIEKSGKIIQFISSVGGAGATTAIVNVGWLLSNRYFKRTIIMDTDFLYGTANLLLDIKTENSYVDVLESLEKTDDYFIETILKEYDQRLYYLGGLINILNNINVNLEAFDTLISVIKKQFNYVLIDSQRGMQKINEVSINRADCFVIMIEMSVASAQNTVRLLKLLNEKQTNRKNIIIANKVGLSSNGALTKESFENMIDREIDYIMPLDERVTLASANIGQPLAAFNCALTNSLESITEDILGKRDHLRIAQALIKNGTFLDKIKNAFGSILSKK